MMPPLYAPSMPPLCPLYGPSQRAAHYMMAAHCHYMMPCAPLWPLYDPSMPPLWPLYGPSMAPLWPLYDPQ